MKVDILGIKIDNFTFFEALEKCLKFINSDKTAVVYTINPEIVVKSDEKLAQILNSADLCVADGIGVVHASWILSTPIVERVTGFDLACDILKYAAKAGDGVFLLGAKPNVAKKAAVKVAAHYKNLVVSGTHDGYFAPDENDRLIKEINTSGAKILFVCLGAPKQENWIFDNREKLHNVRLCIALGGALDVFAGVVKRAPKFFIKANLEWLYRVIRQPSRLIRCLALPKFLFKVLIEKFKKHSKLDDAT